MEKKINLEEIFNDYHDKQSSGLWDVMSKSAFRWACLEFGKQLLELAADNALEVDYVERSMDKDVYSQILNTIKQVE